MPEPDYQPGYSQDPMTSREVLAWFEAGRLPSDGALKHLQKLDSRSMDGRSIHRAPSQESRRKRIDSVLHELDGLVGLHDVKNMVHEIRAYVDVQQRRLELGLASEPQTLHMVFSGAPGTGKTTVARILGRLFQTMDVLPKGHMLEVERADLVGEYIGHTAQKTRDAVKRALGGVMFVDEAYALARGGEKDFGKEAIDTLVKAMEDHRGEFLLILAGYSDEMAWFLATNPGLLSRFPLHLHFPDYGASELAAIARIMLAERQYQLSAEADRQLSEYLVRSEGHWHVNSGNARLVRNLIEGAIRRQSVRLIRRLDMATREELMTLTWADVEGGL